MRQLEFLLDGGFCLFFFQLTHPRYKSSWRCSQSHIIIMIIMNHSELTIEYLQREKRKWKQSYHCTAFQAYYQISMIFIILGCNSTGTLVVNRPNTCATWQFHLHKLGTNISKILGTTKLKFQRTKKTMIPVSTYNCTILLISTI